MVCYLMLTENEWRRKHKNLLKKEKRRIKISSIYDLYKKNKSLLLRER